MLTEAAIIAEQDKVQKEVKKAKRIHGELWFTQVPGTNFFGMLPGIYNDIGYWRYMCQQVGGWDQSLGDWLEEHDSDPSQSGYSELRLTLTGQEMAAFIDYYLLLTGVKKEDVLKLVILEKNAYKLFQGIAKAKYYKTQLAELILPAYTRLRARGFSNYPDLNG